MTLLPLSFPKSISNMSSTLLDYAPEGGKLFLAQAIFNAYRFLVRCPSCPGNPTKPGFIKDEAGKAPKDGYKRRQWACQMSNGKGVTSKCPRASCSEYIRLAQQQLKPTTFIHLVTQVCSTLVPDGEEWQALQAYLIEAELPSESSNCSIATTSTISKVSSTITQTDSRTTPVNLKRRAYSEPPDAPSKADHPIKKARKETCQVEKWLGSALEQLAPIIDVAERWKREYARLTALHDSEASLLPLARSFSPPDVVELSLPLPISIPDSQPMSSQPLIETPSPIDRMEQARSLADLFTKATRPNKFKVRQQAYKQGLGPEFHRLVSHSYKGKKFVIDQYLELQSSEPR